jgi:uridine kinase
VTRVETVVGLAGGTCSGKSLLASRLRRRLGDDRVAILPFDAYYRDQSHLTPTERSLVNYDHPDALDVDAFLADLEALVAGREIGIPVYDFATHTRSREVVTLQPRPIVVTEGILLLMFPRVRAMLHAAIFLDVPSDVRLARRIERDGRERGRDPGDVRRQFGETVEPMYAQYVEPCGVHADPVLLSAEPESVEVVCRLITGLGSERARAVR